MYSARYTEFMYWCTLGLMIASCKLIKRLTGEREGARGGWGGGGRRPELIQDLVIVNWLTIQRNVTLDGMHCALTE